MRRVERSGCAAAVLRADFESSISVDPVVDVASESGEEVVEEAGVDLANYLSHLARPIDIDVSIVVDSNIELPLPGGM